MFLRVRVMCACVNLSRSPLRVDAAAAAARRTSVAAGIPSFSAPGQLPVVNLLFFSLLSGTWSPWCDCVGVGWGGGEVEKALRAHHASLRTCRSQPDSVTASSSPLKDAAFCPE